MCREVVAVLHVKEPNVSIGDGFDIDHSELSLDFGFEEVPIVKPGRILVKLESILVRFKCKTVEVRACVGNLTSVGAELAWIGSEDEAILGDEGEEL
jgi:hypothetical protein